MKKKFKFKKDKTNKILSKWDKIHQNASEFSRWVCLYEAVNMIADKAEEKKIPFNKVEIKPLAIYKYMESTEDIILKQVLDQLYNIKIGYTEKEN
jgi:hypothetical protein